MDDHVIIAPIAFDADYKNSYHFFRMTFVHYHSCMLCFENDPTGGLFGLDLQLNYAGSFFAFLAGKREKQRFKSDKQGSISSR